MLTEAENAALIRAKQAQAAATEQEYLRAAELFAEAATTRGLEVPLPWRYRNEQAFMLAEQGREFKNNTALEQAIDLYEKPVLGVHLKYLP